jgi:hypothetical protein
VVVAKWEAFNARERQTHNMFMYNMLHDQLNLTNSGKDVGNDKIPTGATPGQSHYDSYPERVESIFISPTFDRTLRLETLK